MQVKIPARCVGKSEGSALDVTMYLVPQSILVIENISLLFDSFHIQ